ncbi:cysteine desulfurase family protein [Candidatus Riflebacteria bacterium]
MDHNYFDHNATTPICGQALTGMFKILREVPGNPTSAYKLGREARKYLDEARSGFAEKLHCLQKNLIFVSSGSEANCLAVEGYLKAIKKTSPEKNKVIFSPIEHRSLLSLARVIKENDFIPLFVDVDTDGLVNLDHLNEIIDTKTALVSIMHVNNETGVIQNLEALYAIVSEKGAIFHSDLVQSFAKIFFDFKDPPFDLASTSSHKIYGPKGAGFVFKKEGVDIHPLIHGSHENYFRGGTENLAAIWGFYQAFLEREKNRAEELKFLQGLKEQIITFINSNIPDFTLNSPEQNCMPSTINLSFAGVRGEALMVALDMEGFSLSRGSACASGNAEGSHVLKAMGISNSIIQGALRVSIGLCNTPNSVAVFCNTLQKCVEKLRKVSGTLVDLT